MINLERVTLWIQRFISLSDFHEFLRLWCSNLNSEELKAINLWHRDWHCDCQARKLCRYSLENEALGAPSNVDQVRIACAIDDYSLAPGDHESYISSQQDKSDEEDKGSGQEDG
jgi:hypothetical protein